MRYGIIVKSRALVEVSALVFLLILLGCRPMPTKEYVKDIIVKNFEARHYRVTELQVSDVKPSPNERIYMGSKSYIVYIGSITLVAAQNAGGPPLYKKGRKFSFRDASLEMKEDPYQKGKWIIKNIEGIPVP
jgi:hypothetical protein